MTSAVVRVGYGLDPENTKENMENMENAGKHGKRRQTG
jgi:hypothetical protein